MAHCRGLVALWLLLWACLVGGCGNRQSEDVAFIQACVVDYESACAVSSAGRGGEVASSLLSWSAVKAAAFEPIGPEALVATTPPPPPNPTPKHWSIRRGPAYKGDWLHSFGRDGKEMLPTLWDDTKATFTNPWALAGFAAAGVVGIVVNGTGVDDTVARHYSKKGSQLNTSWDMVGDIGGNPGTHFAIAGAMYFTGLWADDVKTYETSKTLVNALVINGLTTLALKGIVRTRSPNGDGYGWPSGHTSSSFTFAVVLGEAYGPWVGVPLLLGASFVGYERIDARNHDFSDVLSGALIGIAIGHAVSQNHKARIFGFEVIPWTDPVNNGVGLALTRKF